MFYLTLYHNLICKEKWINIAILGEKESVLATLVQNSYSVVKKPKPQANRQNLLHGSIYFILELGWFLF